MTHTITHLATRNDRAAARLLRGSATVRGTRTATVVADPNHITFGTWQADPTAASGPEPE